MQFDPFKQSKIQAGLAKIQTGHPAAYANSRVTSVDDIKRLAGVGTGIYPDATARPNPDLSAEKRRIERERNIRPGDKEWFRLWFAKPELTGERPYDESQ